MPTWPASQRSTPSYTPVRLPRQMKSSLPRHTNKREVNEVNPDALAIAMDLDAARANGTTLGPLHGVPILIKDNIATADKMNNTAGSFALLGAKVPRDSTLAAKLRKAGAIILGKRIVSTNLFLMLSSTNMKQSASGPTIDLLIVPTVGLPSVAKPMARTTQTWTPVEAHPAPLSLPPSVSHSPRWDPR